MKTYLLILLGSFLGASTRYLIDSQLGGGPKSTFLINLSGCFLIGLLFGLINDFYGKIFLIIGLLGSFTTFSSYAWGILNLLQRQEYLLASFYGLGNPALGLLSCWLGIQANNFIKFCFTLL